MRLCIAAALLRTAADEATHIAVHTVRGTGILQGVVHLNAARAAAERAAMTADGVRSVIDSLMVNRSGVHCYRCNPAARASRSTC